VFVRAKPGSSLSTTGSLGPPNQALPMPSMGQPSWLDSGAPQAWLCLMVSGGFTGQGTSGQLSAFCLLPHHLGETES
jgi:hypothetical protein